MKPKFGKWGDVKVGDRVTSQGRHGTGQPAVWGVVERIDGQFVFIRTRRTKGDLVRQRSISNVRKVI